MATDNDHDTRSSRTASGTGIVEPPGLQPDRPPRWSSVYRTLALVVLSLLSIALLPVLLQRYTNQLRDQILQVASPLLELVIQIEEGLTLQAASTRGFALTGDSSLIARFDTVQVQRRNAERRLLALAGRFDSAVLAEAMRLQAATQAADGLADSLLAERVSVQTFVAHLSAQQQRLEAALASGDRISVAVRSGIAQRAAAVSRAERIATVIGGFLVLLALTAVFFVARLGHRYRTAALQLAESEARLREVLKSEHAAREEADAARAAAEERRRDLERVTESRTRLLRGFSHDVKNPLGAADGHLALIAEGIHGPLTPAQKESLERARRSIHAALDLIGHLLDIARAEAGQLEVRVQRFDLRDVVRDATDDFRAQAEKARLRLNMEVPSEPLMLESDPARVRQVLANLLSNAIKYTPAGGEVTTRADRTRGRRAREADWMVASVRDTGRGIPPERVPQLFMEFTRFDASAAEGAGIGLAISQRIAEALGGHIDVESKVGEGSTFRLWLPVARDAAPESKT
jgi:signal transduction histidine kinase